MVQKTTTVQDMPTAPPSTSWPNEGMTESYLNINSFSELLMVIFLSDDFSCREMCKKFNTFSFILQREGTGDLNVDF